jgi:hypothetical protein
MAESALDDLDEWAEQYHAAGLDWLTRIRPRHFSMVTLTRRHAAFISSGWQIRTGEDYEHSS